MSSKVGRWKGSKKTMKVVTKEEAKHRFQATNNAPIDKAIKSYSRARSDATLSFLMMFIVRCIYKYNFARCILNSHTRRGVIAIKLYNSLQYKAIFASFWPYNLESHNSHAILV